MTGHDRDELIRLAIAPDARVQAPADLGDSIFRAVVATPQRRAGLRWARLGLIPPRSLVLLLALVGLLVVAGLVAAVLSRPPSGPGLIGTYHGGPDRTGLMPGPGPAGKAAIAWDVPRPGAMPFTTMPLVADGRVYVADDSGSVAALDESTGATRWEVQLGGQIRGTPALAGDLLIVGTSSGTVAALATANGSQVWTHTVGGVIASLLVVDRAVLVPDGDGTLTAFDTRTGSLLWSVPLGAPMSRGPSMAAGVIYVGADDGTLTALDAASRQTRWIVKLGTGMLGTPTATTDRVYLGRGVQDTGDTHDLLAVDARTGAVVWPFASPAGKQVQMGGLAGSTAFADSEDNSVYALDAATGDVRWTHATDGPIGSLAAIVGDTVYVSSGDRTVRALATDTGAQQWQVSVVGSPTTPAVIDGYVIVGTDLGRVVAIAGSGSP